MDEELKLVITELQRLVLAQREKIEELTVFTERLQGQVVATTTVVRYLAMRSEPKLSSSDVSQLDGLMLPYQISDEAIQAAESFLRLLLVSK